MMPYGFLRAATANNATVKPQTMGGKKYNVLTFMGQNKAPVTGYINDQNMVERVETRIDNAMLGDMFRDYIVAIEGPQSEARASAIIAEAKRLIPNKPIRYVVNTHHHFDLITLTWLPTWIG